MEEPPVVDWPLEELFPALALLVVEDELEALFACYVEALDCDDAFYVLAWEEEAVLVADVLEFEPELED